MALTSDIQRALQNAIGEANNAFSAPDVLSKKKKKRRRGVDDEGESEVEGQVKKRKGKKDAVEEQREAPPNAEQTTTELTKKKKKSKKKDKGKQRVAAEGVSGFPSETIYTPNAFDLQGTSASNPPASTAAFLSALVTAASEENQGQHPPSHAPGPSQLQYDHAPQSPQYMSYPPPPMGYAYPAPHYDGQSSSAPPTSQQQHHPSLFSTPMGVPLNDLAFGSNEDILRALQDLDMAKIANVLKTLEEAAAAANIQNPHHSQTHPPGFLGGPSSSATQDLQAPPPPLNQVPSTAGDILTSASSGEPKQTKPTRNRVDMSLSGPEQHGSVVDHAYLLANKWMNAGKLAEMVKNQGLIYKKGKFSAIEDVQLKDAIENYRIAKGLSPEEMNDMIFAKNEKGARDNAFWSEITGAVPQRPIIAVYHHVRRSYHPMKQQGKWMPSEDALLIEAVGDVGQAWEKVSKRVGRMSADCRDRYRNHIANREVRVTGQWNKEEEEELTRIVTEMTVDQGRDFDNDVFWGKVSQKMGNRRGRQQCRIKWTDSLSKTVKNEGQKPRWSQQDAYILVHKVDSLNVRDDTEIDWKTLPDPGWNFWSAHSLQRRWLTLKRSIKGFEEMTHAEIMDILRHKKAQLPVPPITSTKKRKITSTVTIADSDSAEAPPEAGSSTGPGTIAPRGGVGQSQEEDIEELGDS